MQPVAQEYFTVCFKHKRKAGDTSPVLKIVPVQFCGYNLSER